MNQRERDREPASFFLLSALASCLLESLSRSLELMELFFPPSLTLIEGHFSSFEVAFVAYQHDRHVWVGVLSDFVEPPRQVNEGVSSDGRRQRRRKARGRRKQEE